MAFVFGGANAFAKAAEAAGKADDGKGDAPKKSAKEEELERKREEEERAKELEQQILDELPNYDDEHELDLKGMKSPKVRHNLNALLNSRKFSDVSFVVGAERQVFWGHKVVLAARSPVFAAMLYSRFAEASMAQIPIPDVRPPVFLTLLTAMYTDRCTELALDASSALEVLMAAKRYQIEGLCKRVVKFIRHGLTVHNACDLFGTKVGLLDEEDGALGFIEDNATECVKSRGFQNLSKEHVKLIVRSNKLAIDEADLFRGVLAWGRAELERVKRERAEKRALEKAVADSLKPEHQQHPVMAKAISDSLKDKAKADADADLRAALEASEAAHAAAGSGKAGDKKDDAAAAAIDPWDAPVGAPGGADASKPADAAASAGDAKAAAGGSIANALVLTTELRQWLTTTLSDDDAATACAAFIRPEMAVTTMGQAAALTKAKLAAALPDLKVGFRNRLMQSLEDAKAAGMFDDHMAPAPAPAAAPAPEPKASAASSSGPSAPGALKRSIDIQSELKAQAARAAADRFRDRDPELRDVLADVLKFVRFPLMDLESFATLVPPAEVLPPDHQLALFKLLTERENERNPQKEPWNCDACTFFNAKDADKCGVCGANRPAGVPKNAKVPAKPWSCPKCTYGNGSHRVRCEICNEPMPPPPKAHPKEDRVNATIWYISVPREPRRTDARRMRFLLWGGVAVNELQDVRACIEEAFVAQYKRASPDFVVDIADHASTLTLPQLLTYDAVLSWWGTVNYVAGTGDLLAQYADHGGGVVIGMFACGQNAFPGRFVGEQYWPIIPGVQTSGTPLHIDTKSLLDKDGRPARANGVAVAHADRIHALQPANANAFGGGGFNFGGGFAAAAAAAAAAVAKAKGGDSKDAGGGASASQSLTNHPLLQHVRAFHGGQNSYHAHIRVRDTKCKAVALWSNGQPLVVEGPTPKSKLSGADKAGKQGKCVVLNFYPITSRITATNWNIQSDGGHLMLNALTYVAGHGFLKRSKPTPDLYVPYARAKEKATAAAAAAAAAGAAGGFAFGGGGGGGFNF